MSTVFVTGGAGFIGGNFVHYHLKEHPEDRVVYIDKHRESAKLYGKSPYGEHLKAVAEGKIKY